MQQLFLRLQSGPHRLHKGRVLGCLLHACSITGASQGRYRRGLLDATHAVRLEGMLAQYSKVGQQIILASLVLSKMLNGPCRMTRTSRYR